MPPAGNMFGLYALFVFGICVYAQFCRKQRMDDKHKAHALVMSGRIGYRICASFGGDIGAQIGNKRKIV